MVLSIIKNDIKSLIKPCVEWRFLDPPKPFTSEEFAKALIQTMYDANGIGLAANQVGYPYRVFVMRGHPADFACFNPKIVGYSNEIVELDEGCLSFPNLFVKIKRPRDIRVRFADYNNEVSTHTFTGMTARIFQHELDHLDGKLFYNKVDPYHREKALRAAKKRNKIVQKNKEALAK